MVYTGNIVFESENRKRKDRYTLKNIVLIGMPGAGKSTVGVVIAKKLGYRFMDSDLVIQERTGKMLHEIIEEKGTEGFLTVEGEINASLCCDRTVIAWPRPWPARRTPLSCPSPAPTLWRCL